MIHLQNCAGCGKPHAVPIMRTLIGKDRLDANENSELDFELDSYYPCHVSGKIVYIGYPDDTAKTKVKP